MQLKVIPGNALRGDIHIAADKSISHRALIFAALAAGRSRINHILPSADVLATKLALQQMGVTINEINTEITGEITTKTDPSIKHNRTDMEIHGVGLDGLKPPPDIIELGNSGTAMRLLAGVLCGAGLPAVLRGDESLNRRPMTRIIEPLTRMGARINSDNGRPPLTISTSPKLRPIHYEMPIASAQVKSCILLAGLFADGDTSVTESHLSRDHTERMLVAMSYPLDMKFDGQNRRVIKLTGPGKLNPINMQVPGDLSSAAFFIVGATIIAGSDLTIRAVGNNPTRNGIFTILKRMGANIQLRDSSFHSDKIGMEPVVDIRVRAAQLYGCKIGGADIALSIDEMPAIAVAAACAKGVTEITGAGELRVKESDRIRAVAAALTSLGIKVVEHTDGMTIYGGTLRGGIIDSFGDHRIAMAFAMAAAAAEKSSEIHNCANIATSFPNFCAVANRAGLNIQSH